MRGFWIVVGVLMLLSAGYLFYKAPAGLPEQQVQVPAEPVRDTRLARADPPPPPPPAPVQPESQAAAPEFKQEPKPAPAPVEDKPVAVEAKPVPDAPPPPPAITSATPPAPETPTTTESAAPPEASAEPKIVRNEDGSMVVDGKYRVRGSGTAEDPYTVTWDHLTSIQDEYAPKDGRNVIPPRIKMLDGKHVRVEGNIAFPMMMDEAEECLVMLNQWDGCCIGVPPTPYDAIEVKLKEVVSGDARMTTYGTISGKFRVDPHLVGGWLVGLYVMEQATLKPQAYGGFAP